MAAFQGFYFDCDSTLSTIEGVDELTRVLPEQERAEIAALTHQAMEGELPLARVYEERLARIAPSRQDLDAVGQFYIDHLVQDGAATIAALQFLGKQVGIISGGLLPPVQRLAKHLGIPADHVHAVPLLFDDDGAFVDFDHRSPLWQNGGKNTILRQLPTSHRPVLFVGDGITDLETKATADLFVGFGGIEHRASVEAGAEVFLHHPSLAGVLEVGLTPAEKNVLARDHRFGRLLPIH